RVGLLTVVAFFMCACGGEEGLEFLEDEPYDVVVSDMRMPGMDGAAFLKKVYERYPETVRIVLSGHADDESSVKAGLVAHQWLDKPCSQDELVAALTRIEEGIERLPSLDVRQAVGKVSSLPTPSSTFLQIKDVISNDADAIGAVTDLIAEDPGLTAKVLQLTNSSFFFRGNPVTEVKDAVVRLGLDVVVGVVMLAEVYMKAPNADHFDTTKEQQHCLSVSRLVGEMFDSDLKKIAVMAGLLHDVGRYIIVQVFPEKLEEYTTALQDKTQHIYKVERSIFGTDHGQLAGYLLFLWGFSNDIIDAVVNHHLVDDASAESWSPAAAIYLANQLLRKNEIPDDLLQRLGVQDRIEGWRGLADEITVDSE
ncbi:HDOD domain-containing protein, partial [bacterium]|nr:HDOD domain-containing protein [bacterium]